MRLSCPGHWRTLDSQRGLVHDDFPTNRRRTPPMKRRDFLVSGGGAAFALAAGSWTAAWSRTGTGAGQAPGALPFAAIFDSRFPSSLEFGHGAARLGCEPRPIRGDVTDLWLRQLRPQWARGEGAIVGMSTAASFLCIQQLAAEFWMPVVARVEHIPQADASVHHHMQLHDILMPQLIAALADEPRWPASLVLPLVHTLGSPARSPLARGVAVSRHSPTMPRKLPLVSWAITTRAAGRAPAGHGYIVAPGGVPS